LISHSSSVLVSRSLQVPLPASQPTESAAGGEPCGEPAIKEKNTELDKRLKRKNFDWNKTWKSKNLRQEIMFNVKKSPTRTKRRPGQKVEAVASEAGQWNFVRMKQFIGIILFFLKTKLLLSFRFSLPFCFFT
jgi:hypothetical protein